MPKRQSQIANQQSAIAESASGSRKSASGNRKSAIRRRPTSQRQREACRRNGEKGGHVWREMLRQGFMLPAETLQRVWEGLVKCALWHLTDCSARYAPRFREGIYAMSLVRSLAAAGERIEDYARHVRHVIQAFTDCRFSMAHCRSPEPNLELSNSERKNSQLDTRPSSIVDPPSSIVPILSTALAQVSWRRLRASRGHSGWERRSVVRLLRRLAAERERGQAVTGERLTLLAEDLHRVLFFAAGNFQVRLRRLNRRFEATPSFPGRAPTSAGC